jgi:hypothetical protein
VVQAFFDQMAHAKKMFDPIFDMKLDKIRAMDICQYMMRNVSPITDVTDEIRKYYSCSDFCAESVQYLRTRSRGSTNRELCIVLANHFAEQGFDIMSVLRGDEIEELKKCFGISFGFLDHRTKKYVEIRETLRHIIWLYIMFNNSIIIL